MPQLNYKSGQYSGATRQYADDGRAKAITQVKCPACKSKHEVRYLPERRGSWYYCWHCHIEFNPKKGIVNKMTAGGGMKLMLIDSATMEVVESKSVRVKMAGKDKPENVDRIVKLGVYNGFMVFELADGKQKLYNAALVERVEEL